MDSTGVPKSDFDPLKMTGRPERSEGLLFFRLANDLAVRST
jgi:hypothetical protein